MTWFPFIIMGAAAADSINPCAFSVLFLTIAFLFSLGKERKFILGAGATYIAGIGITYIFIGVGILKVLSFFAIPNAIGKIGAGILVLYSVLGLINEFFPEFPLKLKMPEQSHETIAKVVHKGTIPAAFILGVLVGLFEFPCTGGPYLFVLSLLHDKESFWSGLGYLILYNAIFVLPLVIILVLATNRAVLDRIEKIRKIETKKGRIVLDSVLLLIGLALIMML